jgi:hypothetical protein
MRAVTDTDSGRGLKELFGVGLDSILPTFCWGDAFRDFEDSGDVDDEGGVTLMNELCGRWREAFGDVS